MINEQMQLHQKRRTRVIAEANFIISTKGTTRTAAKEFEMSKSAIYRDMTLVLPMLSEQLATEVSEVLQYNKKIRHLRGGETTRERYSKVLQNRRRKQHEL